MPGPRVAAARSGGGLGRRLVQPRHLARRALVQQRGHRLDARVAHAPAPRRSRQQHVGERDDAHALVVRHEGARPGVNALGARTGAPGV